MFCRECFSQVAVRGEPIRNQDSWQKNYWLYQSRRSETVGLSYITCFFFFFKKCIMTCHHFIGGCRLLKFLSFKFKWDDLDTWQLSFRLQVTHHQAEFWSVERDRSCRCCFCSRFWSQISDFSCFLMFSECFFQAPWTLNKMDVFVDECKSFWNHIFFYLLFVDIPVDENHYFQLLKSILFEVAGESVGWSIILACAWVGMASVLIMVLGLMVRKFQTVL